MASNYIKFYTFFDILRKHSNNENMLSMKKILQMMEEQTGDKIDRRTIYEYIKNFKELGFDIREYSENKKGYYLNSVNLNNDYCIDIFMNYSNKMPVKIEFDNELRDEINNLKGVIDILSDGEKTFIANIETSNDNTLISWILQFGSKAKVIEPHELRDIIKEEIRKLYERYV
jgi:predicted DNA-binding transcriptional regulator YafY